MKVSFIIKKTSASADKTIYIKFFDKGKPQTFATRFKINVNDWEKGAPKRINTTSTLRKDLGEYEEAANLFIEQKIKTEERTPTANELKKLVNKLNGQDEKDFVQDHFDNYIKAKSKELRESTLKITKKTQKLLKEFNPTMEFSDFDEHFSGEFQDFLLGREVPIQNVTANNYLRKVKSFLKWCHKDMKLTKTDLGKDIKLLDEVPTTIFAVESSELAAIENDTTMSGKQIELSERLERIKDLFLMGCYCGMRFEDLQKLNEKMVQNNIIILMQGKTRQIVKIPMLDEAIHIWEKYNHQLPQISNVKANVYLKELFKLLEIDRHVLEIENIGNKVTEVYKPLFEAITFHKSRKTFIINALQAGIPAKMVMMLSGHKQDSTFNKYITFAENVLATEMLKMSRSARSMKIEKAG